MKTLSDFTNLYSLSKTLRFELKPQGKTLQHIQEKGLLAQDEKRAEDYQKVKKLIDEYHKYFIEESLNNLNLEGLDEYYLYYQIPKKEENQKKKFQEIESKLRKQIAERFQKHSLYKNLFAKELIKEDLKNFQQDEDNKKLVAKFDNFTTYFTGFHENRKNIYSAEDKSTAIAFRLVHQNLPKFIDNMHSFEKVKNSSVAEKFEELYQNMEAYLNVKKIEEIFSLEYYSLLLTQAQIDVYNAIIGGKTQDDGTKIQGLNEYINLYNQQQIDKREKLPKLKLLYKQILSDRNAISWLPEEFKKGDDNAVLESIEQFYLEFCTEIMNNRQSLPQLLTHLSDYDLSKIYLKNDTSLTDISQKMFGSWAVIQKAIEASYEKENPRKAKESQEKFEERTSKFFKSFDSFSIGFINDCLQLLGEPYNKKVEDYFKQAGAIKTETDETEPLFKQIEQHYQKVKDLLNSPYPESKNLSQEKKDVELIKNLLDSIKALQWFVKPLLGKGNEPEKDERFYAEFSKLWDLLDGITLLYNKVRNYMTQKPYSVEKFKLNFENSTLLDGWDVNKEADNTALIFRKNGLYYLGIMNKNYNRIFRQEFENNSDDCFEKMEYKLLPGANKMLPKVFFSNSRIAEFNPSSGIIDNYKNETHKKGDHFNLEHCHQLIDFFKSSINKHEDWKHFGFQFSDTKNYADLSGFYREVEQQGYKLTYRNIPKSFIHQMIDEGKLYLFQIYNKDFSPYSKGTPNMHTLYWKMLFDAENLKNVVYKLNGQAEVFYRKSSIKEENKTIHKAKEAIKNKNEQNDKEQSVFDYEIVKDKRYTVDKFQFHVPITLNFKATGGENINNQVNEFLKNNTATHIIGIDRGERHLLYLTLIDRKGNIKQQFSLNEIVNEYKGKSYTTNYHQLLGKREEERKKERESWQTIETIKELKEGYISQVVHKISELMVEYNAIVVLEDLNMGFMRGRQKVEKSVYQKFEKMLIDKLNYLVDKKKTAVETGGVLKALQLTGKFESFQKMGKQSGFLFYVPAWNTSKLDPVTGFVNLFDTRYENVDKAKAFFNKFDAIRFNSAKNQFEFEVKEYSKFNAKADDTQQNWTICTHGTRIKTFRNPAKNSEWDNEEIVLTNEFINFFNQHQIAYQAGDLKSSILTQNEKSFFEDLLHLFKLTVQMRNSITNSEVDYLISPVADSTGNFFDSRTVADHLPKDADANGAYNIARKGLWVLDQIDSTDNLNKLKLAISNKEWLQFVQNKNK